MIKKKNIGKKAEHSQCSDKDGWMKRMSVEMKAFAKMQYSMVGREILLLQWLFDCCDCSFRSLALTFILAFFPVHTMCIEIWDAFRLIQQHFYEETRWATVIVINVINFSLATAHYDCRFRSGQHVVRLARSFWFSFAQLAGLLRVTKDPFSCFAISNVVRLLLSMLFLWFCKCEKCHSYSRLVCTVLFLLLNFLQAC